MLGKRSQAVLSSFSDLLEFIHVLLDDTTIGMGDLFKTLSLGFDQSEPAIECNDEIEQAPEQEGAPAHVLDHIRRR